MSERKIRFAPNQHGGWWAYIDDLGVAAEKPWEASAGLCAVLRGNVTVEWETLPWPVLREAHGVVAGVTHILGASLEAKRAIDAVVYEEEMRELGVSRYVSLPAEERARLAAAAAERLLGCDWLPSKRGARKALKWATVAAQWLPGYGSVVRLLRAALENGYPDRRRGDRLMCRAGAALRNANIRNDIAPDSR